MKALKQKRLFTLQEFTLLKNSLLIKRQSLIDHDVYELPFEQIGSRIVQTRAKGPKIGLVFFATLTFLMGVLSIDSWLGGEPLHRFSVLVALSLLFLAATVEAAARLKNISIYLIGGQHAIQFFANSPSKEKVQDFIDYIIKTKKETLKASVLERQGQMPREIYQQELTWLLDEEIIDQNEYDILLERHQLSKVKDLHSYEL